MITDDYLFTNFFQGLAWETKRDTMKCCFYQFSDILEAVVITDRTTVSQYLFCFEVLLYKQTKSYFDVAPHSLKLCISAIQY